MNASPQVFQESAAVYDLLYGEKDTLAEAEWIANTLENHGCPPRGRLLEFGSGTGRHARILADRGYQVTGVEPSSDMLERAEPHPRVRYLRGDTASTSLEEKCDAVLSLFHVMSYHTSLPDLHAFYDTASRHLDSGGLFAFDVWFTPAVHSLVPEARVLKKENSRISVTRNATPTEDIARSLVTVSYDYTVEDLASGTSSTFTESHAMRHFTQTEIELLAEQHGFELVESCEFLSNAKPSRNTWGVWFTLRKI
ncbi:MAG TPA: methyltransferase domain-containing protein [Pontimonas sp.]|nr:methyltransferase domain-containing protein [Pontimonas sp.]